MCERQCRQAGVGWPSEAAAMQCMPMPSRAHPPTERLALIVQGARVALPTADGLEGVAAHNLDQCEPIIPLVSA